ncbi:MAG: HEPN domain-containing protein [Candidatus Bathyarchaeia archaeon]
MSLEELLRDRIIQRIKPNEKTAKRNLKIASRDLSAAKHLLAEENYDWALSIAYNAMLQAGRALMFLKGFRPSAQFGHIAVVRYIRVAFREQLTERMVDVFDQMRRKRHRAVYEAVDVVSRNEAQNAIKWAEEFVNKVKEVVLEQGR